MSAETTVKLAPDWKVSVEGSSGAGDVWLHLFVGPLSGGVHITPEQAEQLGRLLSEAAAAAIAKATGSAA